jgi:hypothetical protein
MVLASWVSPCHRAGEVIPGESNTLSSLGFPPAVGRKAVRQNRGTCLMLWSSLIGGNEPKYNHTGSNPQPDHMLFRCVFKMSNLLTSTTKSPQNARKSKVSHGHRSCSRRLTDLLACDGLPAKISSAERNASRR